MDYKVLYIDGIGCDACRNKIKNALTLVDNVKDIVFKDEYAEIFLEKDMEDELLKTTVKNCGDYIVVKID